MAIELNRERVILGEVEIDVVETESPEFTNLITDKPVEEGADISDHVRPLPNKVAFTGVIAGDEAAEKYDQLKRYHSEGERLELVGHLDIIEDMVIEQLSPTKNVRTADGFTFNIALKQIRAAVPETSEYVGPDPIDPDADHKDTEVGVRDEEDVGKQQPEIDPTPKSIAAELLKAIGIDPWDDGGED